MVAPLVGAWIEMMRILRYAQVLQSLPLWERGLKLLTMKIRFQRIFVAPLVGAWIEIKTSLQQQQSL